MTLNRRNGRVVRVLLYAVIAGASLAPAGWSPVHAQAPASVPASLPVISEDISPLESLTPVAGDGHQGFGFLRKPPGSGPFPAIILIHGGISTRPPELLKQYALASPPVWVFLAAGYAVAAITYRSREDDPQSKPAVEDSVAAVKYVAGLPYVDPKSVGVYGCSGGGDLALEIAAATTQVRAIVLEEPASFIFAEIFKAGFPKAGPRYSPADALPIGRDPKKYYTPEVQKLTRAKIERISSEILIFQGDQEPTVVPFNNQVLIPELRAAGKKLEVKSYAGEPHCFAFNGRAVEPANVVKALDDAEAFFRRHFDVAPKPIDPRRIKRVTLGRPN